MRRTSVGTHTYSPGTLQTPREHRYLDLPDVVALRAPKPLLVQQCRQDGLFPVAGMEESIEKIAAIYSKAGAKDQFTGRFYDVPHRFDVPMQEERFDRLDRRLKPGPQEM